MLRGVGSEYGLISSPLLPITYIFVQLALNAIHAGTVSCEAILLLVINIKELIFHGTPRAYS